MKTIIRLQSKVDKKRLMSFLFALQNKEIELISLSDTSVSRNLGIEWKICYNMIEEE